MAEDYHEPYDLLSDGARDLHRAITSLIEELQAVDWYHMRADVTGDATLRDILVHNRNEEIEHASMLLEWIRRREPKFDKELHTYLFTKAPVTKVEEGA